jgi:hypothetical protein
VTHCPPSWKTLDDLWFRMWQHGQGSQRMHRSSILLWNEMAADERFVQPQLIDENTWRSGVHHALRRWGLTRAPTEAQPVPWTLYYGGADCSPRHGEAFCQTRR